MKRKESGDEPERLRFVTSRQLKEFTSYFHSLLSSDYVMIGKPSTPFIVCPSVVMRLYRGDCI